MEISDNGYAPIKKDIENREDIFLLLTAFYHQLLQDPTISYIFTDVAKIDLQHHLPILTDFWEMVLFHTDTYRKNAMQVHTNLNRMTPLTGIHFETWLAHFNKVIDNMYEGEKAFLAKQRAQSIATSMQINIAKSANKTI